MLSTIIDTIVSCLFIFITALLVTRVAGLRTFAKMSSIDFATTIAIGSVIASTILNSSVSIVQGSIALVAIVLLQVSTAVLMKKYDWFNSIASNRPILLMRHGKILLDNLDKANVSKEDLMAKLREANALNIEHVKAVVFETTGDISVLHDDSKEDIDEQLLLGVQSTKK